MKYFDAHCHVQFPQYDEDQGEVLARMAQAEVGGILVGTNRASSEAGLELSDGKTLFASVGLHPNHATDEEFDEGVMSALAEDPRVVAIGECGLDFFRPEDVEASKEKQKEVFRAHIRIAKETGKPLMVHARPSKGTDDAYEEAFTMLSEYPGVRANFHFFVGSPSMGKRIAELGHTCSFTAVLTFTSDYDELIRTLPLESILTETDAPYASPAGNRGKRNEPTAVIEVVKAIASIRGEDEEVVRKQILSNGAKVFGVLLNN
jgi:TatD DNase family protein